MPSSLIHELEDCHEAEAEADQLIGSTSSGPISQPPRSSVAGHIARAEVIWEGILDANDPSFPHLTPPNAGSPLSAAASSDPSVWAGRFTTWTSEAYAESQASTPDHAYIGSRLKTCQRYVSDYRDACGIP